MAEHPVERVPLPALGDRVPRRGNALTRWIGRTILNLGGWQLTGGFPNASKFVIAFAPHTSNWDFIIGVFFRQALGLGARFLGKDSLFRPPLGWLMRWLGGTPVYRDAPRGLVGQTVEAFEQHDAFVLAIAPEGTRRAVEAWRTGFYYIALEAGVPISLATIDYGKREIIIGPALVPSGHLEADLKQMQAFFDGVTPKHDVPATGTP